MKSMKAAVLLGMAACLLLSCGGSEKDEELDDIPWFESTETAAGFDASSLGLYKGVIAGSSGTLNIQIQNGTNEVKATLRMDDMVDELSCTSTFAKGQAIKDAVFTGNMSAFTFSVDADGKNPVISEISIRGHEDVMAAVQKETSGSAVMTCEGTYSGGNGAAGVFNFVTNGDKITGISKGGGTNITFGGTLVASPGGWKIDVSGKGNSSGVSISFSAAGLLFNANDAKGTWTITWTGGSNNGTFAGLNTK